MHVSVTEDSAGKSLTYVHADDVRQQSLVIVFVENTAALGDLCPIDRQRVRLDADNLKNKYDQRDNKYGEDDPENQSAPHCSEYAFFCRKLHR